MKSFQRVFPVVFVASAASAVWALPQGGTQPTSRTYTTTADFAEGTQINVNATVVADQLQLNAVGQAAPLPLVNLSMSGRGTMVRIDANTGAVIGEYRTSPALQGVSPNPSRTSVDSLGNVWIGNRGEAGLVNGVPRGSVVKIGVVLGGTRVNAAGQIDPQGEYLRGPFAYNTCVDRDGDGLIRTSRGLGNVLDWPNLTDGNGGATARVEDALDEAILIFQRTNAVGISHVSVDANDDVWVGGYPRATNLFDRLQRDTGAILTTFAPPVGGSGGSIGPGGILWSSSLTENALLRYDIGANVATAIPLDDCLGIGLSPSGGLWATSYGPGQVRKVEADGTVGPANPTRGGALDLSTCVTPVDENVWVDTEIGSQITRLSPTGVIVKHIPLGGDGLSPRGLAVDSNGKVWTTCALSNTAKRIDPNGGADGLGAVDLTVPLGSNANPFNFSDMTGLVGLAVTQPSGLWNVVYDSQVVGNEYGLISWNASVPAGTTFMVEFRVSDDPTALSLLPFQTAQNGVSFSGVFGRYVEVRVRFRRPPQSTATPVLFDLTIEGLGDGPPTPECKPGQRIPGSLLVFPEFDNRTGDQTMLTVSNTQAVGENVDVEFVYIGRFGVGGTPLPCLEFNRTHRLTPNDTLSVLTRFHNPQQEQGFVYVFAKSPISGAAIVHDHLVGNALVVDGIEQASYSFNPYVYLGIGPAGSATDVDGDGLRDLDNVEYSCSPDELFVPRFLGQSPSMVGELVLLNLTGGAQFDASVDFLIYNDNEEVFSAQTVVRCWSKQRLSEVSGAFLHSFLVSSNQNQLEILGAPTVESGWFRMNGKVADSAAASFDDPAILALYVEGVVARRTADLPWELGGQTNGDLYPLGLLGDTTR